MIHILFRDYAVKAGLPPELRHEHCLKHSLATHLVAKNADVLAIKDWLGHADVRSTMVYLRIRNPKRLADAQKIYDQG